MPQNKKPALTEEQQKALQDEMRNNQAVGKRATIAINLLPTIIRTYPGLSEEEMVEKATKLTETAMAKLLGITFTPNE